MHSYKAGVFVNYMNIDQYVTVQRFEIPSQKYSPDNPKRFKDASATKTLYRFLSCHLQVVLIL